MRVAVAIVGAEDEPGDVALMHLLQDDDDGRLHWIVHSGRDGLGEPGHGLAADDVALAILDVVRIVNDDAIAELARADTTGRCRDLPAGLAVGNLGLSPPASAKLGRPTISSLCAGKRRSTARQRNRCRRPRADSANLVVERLHQHVVAQTALRQPNRP